VIARVGCLGADILRDRRRRSAYSPVEGNAMRVLLTAALVFVIAAPASAGNLITLRAVEKAFYDAKMPFQTDWQPTPVNPYLVPMKPPPTGSLPARFASHIRGWASSTARSPANAPHS
jgi:hypothetical protein